MKTEDMILIGGAAVAGIFLLKPLSQVTGAVGDVAANVGNAVGNVVGGAGNTATAIVNLPAWAISEFEKGVAAVGGDVQQAIQDLIGGQSSNQVSTLPFYYPVSINNPLANYESTTGQAYFVMY